MSAIDPLLQQPAAQAVAWALLHFVWQGALISLVTAVALIALRRSAADVRYVVAAIGMSLMLTLPIVTGVQKWQALNAPTDQQVSLVATAPHAPAAIRPHATTPRVVTPVASVETPRITLGERFVSAARPRLEPLLPMCLLIWILGVGVLSLRLMTGWLWVQRLRTHGVVRAGDFWQKMAARLARQLHIARTISLLESTLVEVPTVVGWIKPVVLLPTSALAGLTPRQLEAILAHELAHIRRHDYLVNLLQTLVETLLFYHPAVWWLSSRIRTERENCCDDLAVSLCGDPVTYASALADLESLRGGTSLAMAATGGSLVQRVRRLLGAPASHAGRGPAWLAGSAAIVLICGMAVGADGLRQRQASTPSQRPATTEGNRKAVPSQASTPELVDRAREAMLQDLDEARQRQDLQAAADALGAQEARAAILAEQMRSSADAALAEQSTALSEQSRTLATLASTMPTATLTGQEAATLARAEAVRGQADALHAQAATLATTPLAPMEPALAMTIASQTAIQDQQERHESSGNWVWSNNGEKLAVSYSGTFDFTDDDTDVRQLSPGGYLKISDQAWLGRHTIEIRERDGSLDRRYYVNGSERPFEPEGRQWLHDHLPKFVRNTGIGATGRVARLLKSGGPSAVMAEITRIDGSYVKRIYFSELFKQASLTGEQYRQAMQTASREVRSDYELATLLISLVDRLPADDASRAAYFNAAAGISSDYELRRVYSTMLKRGPVNQAMLSGILEHSSTIESDYELSELLRQIVQQQPLDAQTAPAFFKAVSTVQSDYERHRILTASLRTAPVDPSTLAEALTRAADMTSDYEAATFLLDVLKTNGVEGPARAPFFKVVDRIGSSYERGRVLQAVVRKSDASNETLLAALQSCGRITSNYDRAQVLLLAASTRTLTGELRDAYLDAADKLQGYEQGQVMTALVKSERRK